MTHDVNKNRYVLPHSQDIWLWKYLVCSADFEVKNTQLFKKSLYIVFFVSVAYTPGYIDTNWLLTVR